jgi:hypothetical protein
MKPQKLRFSVTADVARLKPLPAQIILHPFYGNGDVFMCVKDVKHVLSITNSYQLKLEISKNFSRRRLVEIAMFSSCCIFYRFHHKHILIIRVTRCTIFHLFKISRIHVVNWVRSFYCSSKRFSFIKAITIHI